MSHSSETHLPRPLLVWGDTTPGGITAWDTQSIPCCSGSRKSGASTATQECPGLLSPSTQMEGETTIPQEFTVELRKMQ